MAADLTPREFALAVLRDPRLRKRGIKPTPQNVRAIEGWEGAEGGHWNNDAEHNPLNTTMPAKGAGNTGTQGNIKVYPDWRTGVDATVRTLTNGLYSPILSALANGHNANAVGAAIERTPWGTGGLARKVISGTPAPKHLPDVQLPDEISRRVKVGTKTAFDEAGYDQARKRFVLGQMLGKNPDSILVKSGLLSTTAPSRADFTEQELTSKTVTSRRSLDGLAEAKTAAPRGRGVSTFDGKPVAAWVARELEYAREHGWKGTVNSGFRSYAKQKEIYNSGVRPAAKPGQSNHEGSEFPRGAVDVSDAATLSRILRRKRSPLVWAGAKDPPHFSHPHGGSY